ncbi:MAG: YwbE family protein [Megasphaera sp.]|uniref:YwbE family protein n=1 Tax=Megasphaera sueciensis TaxID=349094 RepID=UPI003D031981|nr:YwbE family protein [Megasphaera sp.]MCI1823885.1 YwbE family protein [Megasphaera sp.]
MNGTERKNIRPGISVKIVQKQHQKTGQLTEGIVKDILTRSAVHPRGIKVRLDTGIIGRVQEILDTSDKI